MNLVKANFPTSTRPSKGRTTPSHTHLSRTAAGRTKPHPVATKPSRRKAGKAARASRKANR